MSTNLQEENARLRGLLTWAQGCVVRAAHALTIGLKAAHESGTSLRETMAGVAAGLMDVDARMTEGKPPAPDVQEADAVRASLEEFRGLVADGKLSKDALKTLSGDEIHRVLEAGRARKAERQPEVCKHGIRLPWECKDCLYEEPAPAPAPDVQTALVDALEGLMRDCPINLECDNGDPEHCDDKNCWPCRARKALALVGRKP